MDFENNKCADGSIHISQDVVASIAKFAALEIDGVAEVSTGNIGVRGLITKANYTKPVKIELNDEVVNAEINILVKNGYRIPELSSAIQNNVKNAIQSMTGLTVARVDVVVAGIAAGGKQSEAK